MANWFKIAKRAQVSLYVAILLLVLSAFWSYKRLPKAQVEGDGEVAKLAWPSVPDELPELETRDVFRSVAKDSGEAESTGPISSNYRLAGTFLQYGSSSAENKRARKAILDDLERKTQAMVEEGEVYQGIDIVRISKDHVLLAKDGVEEELWLSFRSKQEKAGDAETQEGSREGGRESGEVLEETRFGKRVGERRWEFEKEALREFYQDMMDDPERAVDIYETMRPKYDENEDITGYKVDIVGEKDFFNAVGLKNGDVVKKVNSMDMTSRGRAEYFMKEFMQDRINAVVLDVEREGDSQKMIYLLR